MTPSTRIAEVSAAFIRKCFKSQTGFIPLHEPRFLGREREYLSDTIDSTFVSSVGEYVNRFERMIAETTGSDYAIATVNGTAALHVSLILAGVKAGDEVITQPLTFVATANAISYIGASPVFLDVDRDSLGLSPKALKVFLEKYAKKQKRITVNKTTGKRISACVPMHTFGFPCRIDEVAAICAEYNIPLVEDAAESLGSYYKNKHTGCFGLMGCFSFNGNKIITAGGGGAIVTNDRQIASKAKHLTTTAKIAHPWAFIHDQIGFNYRMPNLNAALLCAQLEQLPLFLESKRKLAKAYSNFFIKLGITFVSGIPGTQPNFWLNSLLLKDDNQRKDFLEYTNKNGIMTRPCWELINKLSMYKECQNYGLPNALWIAERLVNIPSSVIIE